MIPPMTTEEKLFRQWQAFFGIDLSIHQYILPISSDKLVKLNERRDFTLLTKEISKQFGFEISKNGLAITDALCEKMGYFCYTHMDNATGIHIWKFGKLQ